MIKKMRGEIKIKKTIKNKLESKKSGRRKFCKRSLPANLPDFLLFKGRKYEMV